MDPILTAWEETGQSVQPYTAGTWGPSQAIALIERDGRTWHEKRTEAPQVNWTEFGGGAMLADALARKIADRLALAIAARGHATLAVSGGSTPKAMFATLSREAIDWARVTVTLVDERMVPPSDERSNQRLVSLHLLQNHAAAARFRATLQRHGRCGGGIRTCVRGHRGAAAAV